jgi:hypothetical protein
MTKRDRMAVFISFCWGVWALYYSLNYASDFVELIMNWVPLIAYWGYRFINKGQDGTD